MWHYVLVRPSFNHGIILDLPHAITAPGQRPTELIFPAKKSKLGGTLFTRAYLPCENRQRGAAMTYAFSQLDLISCASAVVCQTVSAGTQLRPSARHEPARHKELEASANADPRYDAGKASQLSERSQVLRQGLLKRSPRHGEIDLVDYHKNTERKGISEPTAGAVTAAIAHEVKQPLAAMVTNANAGLRWLKRSEPDLEEVQAALERIVRDGHRANQVIANVRAIFGKDRCEKARVNVNSLINEVLRLIREELEGHGISVRSELIDGLPEVVGERGQLQQALLNLVMNAIDAMSAVGRERRLTVKSQLDAHGRDDRGGGLRNWD